MFIKQTEMKSEFGGKRNRKVFETWLVKRSEERCERSSRVGLWAQCG